MRLKTVILGDIAIPDRVIVSPETSEATVRPYLGLEQIASGTGHILSYETNSAEGKSTTFAFDDSHVLYGKLRPYLNKVAVPDRVGRCSTEIIPLKPQGIDREYLALLLRSEQVVKAAMSDKTGSRMPRADMDALLGFEVAIHDSDIEQLKIADRLKAQLAEVETARQAAQAQLRDAATLRTKALESLFSSIANWAPIGDAAKLQSGYAFKSDNFKTSGVRLLRNANILPGKVYWDDAVFMSESDSEKYPSYALSTGDVLISLDRPIISSGIKVARVGADDLPALLVQRVGRFLIDPLKLDADYLYAYLQTDLFISKISGHDQSLGVPHISPSQVEAIEIPLPEISVQRELSKQLNDVTSTWRVAVAAMQSQLNDLSKLPKAILAQAFEV
jgi:type I restriction enzyme S subunit